MNTDLSSLMDDDHFRHDPGIQAQLEELLQIQLGEMNRRGEACRPIEEGNCQTCGRSFFFEEDGRRIALYDRLDGWYFLVATCSRGCQNAWRAGYIRGHLTQGEQGFLPVFRDNF